MKQNDFYEVDGCMDFIPVKLIKEYKHLNLLEVVSTESGFRPFVPNIYRFPKVQEPQKVTIPKFVAEWIEEIKETTDDLSWIWSVYPAEHKTKKWLEQNTEKFMRAWLDGYEVAQGKLYTVEIAEAILTKITRGSNIQYKMLPFGNVTDVFDKAIYTTRLTEQEIKQKDERLWQFAKEVE